MAKGNFLSVAGGTAGAYLAGPAGAAAGAQLGSALGDLMGGGGPGGVALPAQGAAGHHETNPTQRIDDHSIALLQQMVENTARAVKASVKRSI